MRKCFCFLNIVLKHCLYLIKIIYVIPPIKVVCVYYYSILDINYVDFILMGFTPQAKLEEAFIYRLGKPTDSSIGFSYRLKP